MVETIARTPIAHATNPEDPSNLNGLGFRGFGYLKPYYSVTWTLIGPKQGSLNKDPNPKVLDGMFYYMHICMLAIYSRH